MKHTLSDIAAKCDEADMVLVGIGEEFQYDWDILLRNERYQEIEKEIEQKEKKEREEYRWIVPFIQKMALEKYPDLRLREAYRNLQKIIEGKNYFILSITMDDHLYRNGFQEDRIVTPCGGFRKMQCDHNCCGLIMEPDEDMYQKVLAYFYKEDRKSVV